jgi:hypothetical protein
MQTTDTTALQIAKEVFLELEQESLQDFKVQGTGGVS